MGRKDTIFGGKIQCLLLIMHERQQLNYRDFRGNIYLHKVCFYIYSPCHCYACRWIFLSYTTLFISWTLVWVLTSLYPLQVFGISLTSFKGFKTSWPSSFTSTLVKGTDNLRKFRGIFDGLNESHRQISSGVGKTAYDSMSAIQFRITPKWYLPH